MNLSELLKGLNIKEIPYRLLHDPVDLSLHHVNIDGISIDSRTVKKNHIFAAFSNDPHANGYITQAIESGAVAIIAHSNLLKESLLSKNSGVIFIESDAPRQVVAHLASMFYGNLPNQCVAVTGTAGKTSVCSLVLQFWNALKIKAASIGTLGLNHTLKDLHIPYASSLTTPDVISLHQGLAQLKKNGIDHVVMEASSHGLDQYRLDGVQFKVAAFTNFSQDHLDYHPTMEAYFQAKTRLFDHLIHPDGWAVLNADIPEYEPLTHRCNAHGYPIYSFGKQGNFMRLNHLQINKNGQILDLDIAQKNYQVCFPLMGTTQAYNLMCAMTIVISLGAPIDTILQITETLSPIPGRLSFAGQHPNGAMIYVDYAHKPQALEYVLKDMRPYCKGRLHLVFGCGGDRDPYKRSLMGQVASIYADNVVVTDDNPRSEDPQEIRRAVLSGCPRAKEIGDRRLAIEWAIQQLNPQDILIIAGKGHETYQIMGSQTLPFDDMNIVEEIITKFHER